MRRYRGVFIALSFVLCGAGLVMAIFDLARPVGVVLIALAMPGILMTRGGAAGVAAGD